MSESDLLQTTDAEVWAREFVARFDAHRIDVDVDVMLTWFANAIETGRTAGQADSVQRRTLEAVDLIPMRRIEMGLEGGAVMTVSMPGRPGEPVDEATIEALRVIGQKAFDELGG